jgi:hypothetical protein
MKRGRKIVVEALIPEEVETVWDRTQEPSAHVLWDIRFTAIRYLDELDDRGFRLMDYRTDIAFGLEVAGVGRYLHSTPLEHSTFEFDSDDWKSIIEAGRGVWLYERRGRGTYFKTVYDYAARYGWVGGLVDALIFRRLLQLATEWGFETLRQWCAGDRQACTRRRSRVRFMLFMLGRLLGRRPREGAARSWLGKGNESPQLTSRAE